MDSTYEHIGAIATDTGEIDLIENDLYETSEAEITQNKKGNAGIAPNVNWHWLRNTECKVRAYITWFHAWY